MKKAFVGFLLISMLFLVSCSLTHLIQRISDPSVLSETALPTEAEVVTVATPLTLQATADLAISALANENMTALADLISPAIGVRFSPYAYVTADQLVFYPSDLPGLLGSNQVYTWGAYDGSGEPIDLTFAEYYDEFVYSADFANAEQVAVNERLGQGNTINNISEFYPGSSFVEYYFSGFDPQYTGMDWQSLRLVFIQQDGIWYLVGIVHDEWTI